MKLALSPRLRDPDFHSWEHHFPNGLGVSVFSSPAWQKLMLHEIETGWRLKMLENQIGATHISLPVFVRTNVWKRFDISVQPIAYYVTPIQHDVVDSTVVDTTLKSIASARTSTFSWWLPPWSSWNSSTFDSEEFHGLVRQSAVDTYVISLSTDASEFVAKRVSKTQRWQARASVNRGLKVIDDPPPEMIDEYYSLYLRVHKEEGWEGAPYSREFFREVSTALDKAGELLVMVHLGRVVGGGLLLYDRRAVHYFQGTTDRSVRGVFPHSVLCMEAIWRASYRHLPFVNLGGVNRGNQGLIQFKCAWGASPVHVPFLRWRCNVAQAVKNTIS